MNNAEVKEEWDAAAFEAAKERAYRAGRYMLLNTRSELVLRRVNGKEAYHEVIWDTFVDADGRTSTRRRADDVATP